MLIGTFGPWINTKCDKTHTDYRNIISQRRSIPKMRIKPINKIVKALILNHPNYGFII